MVGNLFKREERGKLREKLNYRTIYIYLFFVVSMPAPYDWEAARGTLAELYLVEGLPLKQVMDIMRERYGFTPRLLDLNITFVR